MPRISIYEQWEKDNKLFDILLLVSAWSRDGVIQQQIANKLKISVDTLIEYKKKYPEFSDALKRGKEPVDIEVENALLKKALGFKEIIRKPVKLKTVNYINGKREKEEETIQMIDEEIYIAPDTTAQIYWLKNRKPEQWRDKREIETVNDDPIEIILRRE